MSKTIKYPIDNALLIKYISFINNKSNNSHKGMKKAFLSLSDDYTDRINEKIKHYKNNKESKLSDIYLDVLKQIAENNNGYITGEYLKSLKISRQYLTDMVQNGTLEKLNRGIYILSDYIYDDYYSLQKKYKKVVFSHMTALYFYNLTEEIPYKKTITVPTSYHSDYLNSNCFVFYSKPSQYNIGLTTLQLSTGFEVKTYDIERCICDIIIHKNSLDFEQVKKTVKMYVKSKKKDYMKLSKYARLLHEENKVMEFIGMYEE